MIFLEKINFENLDAGKGLFSCFLMTLFYVASLYFWNKKNWFDRNDPAVLKRRFISVFITCIVCTVFIYFISQSPGSNSHANDFHYLNDWLGFKAELGTTMKAFAVGILLTLILFSGPLVQDLMNCYLDYVYIYEHSENFSNHSLDTKQNLSDFKVTIGDQEDQQIRNSSISTFREQNKKFHNYLLRQWKSNFDTDRIVENLSDLAMWRNYVVCPSTEEFVFRSCMIALVYPFLGATASWFITPLFFGIAHLHHIIEGFFNNDLELDTVIGQHLFQFAYTYLFGIYSSYLFVRTGSFFASFASHMFCNFMGFPNIVDLINDFEGWTRIVILIFYVIGFGMFSFLITCLTEPTFYNNQLYL